MIEAYLCVHIKVNNTREHTVRELLTMAKNMFTREDVTKYCSPQLIQDIATIMSLKERAEWYTQATSPIMFGFAFNSLKEQKFIGRATKPIRIIRGLPKIEDST